MYTQLSKAKISAHHGAINRENELAPALMLIQKHPEIDMIEVDFVYHNGKFISSHNYDEDTICKGSELEAWLSEFIPLNKIIWIDIKDSTLSIFSENFSKFDIDIFFNLLRLEKKKFAETGILLENFILIGCQYEHLIDKIDSQNNDEFMIAYDIPRTYSYVAKTISPACMDNIVDQYVQEHSEIVLSEFPENKCNIICLDLSFFPNIDELINMLKKIDNISIVIIYSIELTDNINVIIPGKHIIVQYNYHDYV